MSTIKEIWCIHHSHLDVGFTHPAPLLMDYQCDYIEQAIDLCLKTADYSEEARFRWTCEATAPVAYWLKTARPARVRLFKQLALEGRISVAALPMHTTPCASAPEMAWMVAELDALRGELGLPIQTAINHDVNGQPWTMAQVLLDSGVNFYKTGINIHFGGIPFPRPAFFRWQAADGRELLTFLGEHYSLFSQFLFTAQHDTARTHAGVCEYAARLEQQGYAQDFAVLTATNPPQYDNNAPDAGLADLIARYNAEGHAQRLRFATPEMVRDRLLAQGTDSLPVYRGDWTDFWNFGCASSARETMVNRRAKDNFQRAELLECLVGDAGPHYREVKRRGWGRAVVYDEHTWGAAQSTTDPRDFETGEQQMEKLVAAYEAASASAYLVSTQLERLAHNPHQADRLEGIVAVNPTCVSQNLPLRVPQTFFEETRQLAASRGKRFLPYAEPAGADCGRLELPPFSSRTLSLEELARRRSEAEAAAGPWKITPETIETPFYRVILAPHTGRVLQIRDLTRNADLLDAQSPWAFFEAVRETVDARYEAPVRETLFDRDEWRNNRNLPSWNQRWHARREGPAQVKRWSLEPSATQLTLAWESELPGFASLRQKIVFYADTPYLGLWADGEKLPVETPEALYFAFPLRLAAGWECRFDSAGQFVRLDDEQLGAVSRDYVTVDQSVSLLDAHRCVTLLCPDAPMVQVGGFNFGRMQPAVPRTKNPLLLAWPMNNYWNTNFVADQAGHEQFRYGFNVHDAFDPAAVYADSCRARELCALNPAVRLADAPERTLLQGKGPVLALYARPSETAADAFVLTLFNPLDEDGDYTLTLPDGRSMDAAWVSPQGKVLAAVAQNAAVLTVPVPARKLGTVEIRPRP